MGIMTAVAVGSLAYGIYQGNRQMKMQKEQIQQAGDIADQQLAFQLEQQAALDKQKAEYELDLQNLTIRHESLIAEYDMRVQSLEREADAMADALKKQSRRNPALWVAIGVASGMAITYGAYRVFDE